MRTRYSHNVAAIASILAVSLLIMGKQLLLPGVYCCIREDTVYYLNWTRQFADALSSGVLYPRWMPDSHAGYGNPTFVFYSPLVVYITAIMKLATGDMVLSVALVKLAGLALSGVFMYLFISRQWGSVAGLVSALVYMLLPFRIFDQYFIGVFPSKFAFVWFPLILHFTRTAGTEPRPGRGTAGLAVSYALLCLTHLLSGYMFAWVILAYGLASAGRGRLLSGAARTLSGLALGLALAGFFLLPVLVEGRLVHLDSFGLQEWGRYWNNFLFYVLEPVSRFNPPFYGYLAKTVLWSFAAGLAVYLIGRIAWSRRDEPVPVFFLLLGAVCLFTMSSASALLWELVPGLSMMMFPTRWAAVMVFALACAAGAGFRKMSGQPRTPVRIHAAVFALFLAAPVVAAAWLDGEIISKSCRYTATETAAFPPGMDVEEYVPMNVSLEWLRNQQNNGEIPKVFPLTEEIPVKIGITRWDVHERRFSVESKEKTRIAARTFYFPGWRAWLDGRETAIGIQPVTGAMMLDVPAGSHEVALRFRATPARLAGWAVSALAALAVILLLRLNRSPVPDAETSVEQK